jgi:hypothetical protein
MAEPSQIPGMMPAPVTLPHALIEQYPALSDIDWTSLPAAHDEGYLADISSRTDFDTADGDDEYSEIEDPASRLEAGFQPDAQHDFDVHRQAAVHFTGDSDATPSRNIPIPRSEDDTEKKMHSRKALSQLSTLAGALIDIVMKLDHYESFIQKSPPEAQDRARQHQKLARALDKVVEELQHVDAGEDRTSTQRQAQLVKETENLWRRLDDLSSFRQSSTPVPRSLQSQHPTH